MTAIRPELTRHGLSQGEQRIMNLYDAGQPAPAICRVLKLSPDYVTSVVREYSFGSCWRNSSAFERGVRAACAEYTAALAATGRRYA